MTSVTIAELKANLSKYLRRVRAGEEILVCDRSTPVGRLVPLSFDEGFDAEEQELAAAGVLRLPSEQPRARASHPGAHIDAATALAALDADRDG